MWTLGFVYLTQMWCGNIIIIIIIIIIIKARLQPQLESNKLYTQGHQQGKQPSKEKEKK